MHFVSWLVAATLRDPDPALLLVVFPGITHLGLEDNSQKEMPFFFFF